MTTLPAQEAGRMSDLARDIEFALESHLAFAADSESPFDFGAATKSVLDVIRSRIEISSSNLENLHYHADTFCNMNLRVTDAVAEPLFRLIAFAREVQP